MNRKPISTRTRFEIFKRDGFACQYCGRTPPVVILHVDHIIAVANGGDGSRENLITSCSDCNLGKSNVPIGDAPEPLKATLQREIEAAKQSKQYNRWLREIRNAKDADFQTVSSAIISAQGEDPAQWVIAGPRARSVRAILRRLPAEAVVDAVQIADEFWPFRFKEPKTFRYFCGVCWSMVDRAEGRITNAN